MTKKDIEKAEHHISLSSEKGKPDYLEYSLCLAAARGKCADK